ncbi:MAG TPA: flagellar hook-associated protein FlgL [bacterium]|nr:flagellar hook-associated protein FlgL [bacterium]
MRVTSFMVQNNGIRNLNKNYQTIDKLTYQGSTLKKVQFASDSPIDTVNQMKFKGEALKLDQYLTNITDAKSWLNTIDSLLAETKESLQRARILTVQAGNDTNSASDRAFIAEEINQILETLVEDSNSTIGDSFLFGGTEILDSPFNEKPFKITRGTSQDADGTMKNVILDVEYVGDYKPVYREIETNSLIQINENGNELFMAAPNVVQIPKTVQSASQSLSELNGVSSGGRGYFSINDELFYFDTDKDSLMDLKNLINARDVGVDAEIDGQLTGKSVLFTDPASALGFSGTFKINGKELSVVASDSAVNVVSKINALTSSTGVSASIGTNENIVLDGGVEFSFSKESGVQTILSDLGLVDFSKITSYRNFPASNSQTDVKGGTFEINGTAVSIADNASVDDIVNAINAAGPSGITASVDAATNQVILSGDLTNLKIRDSGNDASLTSNVMTELGFLTKSGDIKLNIDAANVTKNYNLKITSENYHQIFLSDVKDSHFLRDAGVITGAPNQKSPNNITNAAQVEKRTIFDVLIKLRDDLLNNNATDLNGVDLGYIDGALNNIVARDSAVGAKVNRLESVASRLGTLKLNNEELLGNAEEVDYTEILTKFQQMQNVQTAALKINAQIMQMSLMDYL